MNKQGAIYCINCIYYRDDEKHFQVLGSIDMWGRLIIKRVHNMNTFIDGTATLTLSCPECHYRVDISITSKSPSLKQGDSYEYA